MSKATLNFNLKDLYAIKHALQLSVRNNESTLENGRYVDVVQTRADIEHENYLVRKIDGEIKWFKSKYQID